MSFHTRTQNQSRAQGRKGRRIGLAAGLLAVLSLVLAACGAAEPTQPPAAAAPTAEQPVAAPTVTVPLPTAPSAVAAPTDAPAIAAVTPLVQVSDQAIVEDQVVIAEVVSAGPGWLVVHADGGGKPGAALGFSPISDGSNLAVAVPVDTSSATPTLYAMLHTDGGTLGTYEFPGPDAPVVVEGQMVSPAFQVTGGLSAQVPATAATASPAVTAAAAAPKPTAPAGPVLSGEAEVEAEDMQFQPRVLRIRVGTRVKFGARDEVPHSFTSDTGVWDSGLLSKGEEFTFTFTEPGEYPYHCKTHGGPGGQGLSGTIIVVP